MAYWIRLYQSFLEKNGPFAAALVITAGVTVFSVLFTGVLIVLIDPQSYLGMLLIGLLVPLILSPPIGYSMALLFTELARAHRALQRVADRDMLTDAYTRRYFVTAASERLAASLAANNVDTIVLLDVDDFKRINDSHGHPMGDRVLKEISNCCQRLVRDQDVFARIGGEEFAILIGGATPARALPIIERMRLAIRQIEIQTAAGTRIELSASFGAAPSLDPAEADSSLSPSLRLERALAAADEALYEAKHAGKNQTVIAGPRRRQQTTEALA